MKLSMVVSTHPTGFDALAYQGKFEANVTRIAGMGFDYVLEVFAGAGGRGDQVGWHAVFGGGTQEIGQIGGAGHMGAG